MLLLVRVKLTKAWLGDQQPGNDGVRRFRKNGRLIRINVGQWREQFKKAASDLGICLNVNHIQPAPDLLPASIHLYTRHYSNVNVDYFESFRKGTVLNIEFRVDDAVSLENFRRLMDCVGQWHGLSPWGNKFGYGTFEVLEIEKSL